MGRAEGSTSRATVEGVILDEAPQDSGKLECMAAHSVRGVERLTRAHNMIPERINRFQLMN
jgi:hypothetical protein